MVYYLLMRQIQDTSGSDEVSLQRKFGNEQYVWGFVARTPDFFNNAKKKL